MAFAEYYNYRRYHEGLGNATPYDVYTVRHLEIIKRRKEAESRTLQTRKGYIEPSGIRGMALKVSTFSKAHFVPLSLKTYIALFIARQS